VRQQQVQLHYQRWHVFPGLVAGLRNPVVAQAALQRLGPWRPVGFAHRPVDSFLEANAAAALAMVLRGGHHSNFFVPILRAAQGLPDPRANFVCLFIGVTNYDAIVARLRSVFLAAGVGAGNTPWNDAGYIDQERQEALLDLEEGLLQYWPRVNAGAGAVGGVTAGQALSTVLGERLRRAQQLLQMQDEEENV